MKRLSLLAVALAIGLSSCQKHEEPDTSGNNGSGDHPVDPVVLNLPDTPFNYANLTLPNHITGGPVANGDNTPATNPTTNEGATLGRVLFYDTQLSLNTYIKCLRRHIYNCLRGTQSGVTAHTKSHRVKHRLGWPPLRGVGGAECLSIAAPTRAWSRFVKSNLISPAGPGAGSR